MHRESLVAAASAAAFAAAAAAAAAVPAVAVVAAVGWHGDSVCARMTRKIREVNRPSPLTSPPRILLWDFVSAEGGNSAHF